MAEASGAGRQTQVEHSHQPAVKGKTMLRLLFDGDGARLDGPWIRRLRADGHGHRQECERGEHLQGLTP